MHGSNKDRKSLEISLRANRVQCDALDIKACEYGIGNND